MATIRQRGPYRWEVQVRRHGWPDITRTLRSKNEAQAWASTIESEIARGTYVDRTEADTTTFGQLAQRYLDEVTPLKKGAEIERCRINALLKTSLAQYRVSAVSSRLIAEWRDSRLAQVSGSTVNRDLNLISHVFTIALKDWGIPINNPVSLIRRPRNNKARRRRLTAEEEAGLLAELTPSGDIKYGAGRRNIWMRPLVELALETAMRRSELLNLLWEHVHLSQHYLHLEDSKNSDTRDVPLSSKAVHILSDLPRSISGRVFPISANVVKLSFVRAVKRAGITDLHFHDLRHEATSRLATKLSNVLELAAVTGHRTLTMLNRYYHPTATALALKLG